MLYLFCCSFSYFLLLPLQIEDEGNHGNDETRLFILSSLAQSQMSRVACILCEEKLLVFDRYPLVDGSFFLSPKQHSSGCIEVSSLSFSLLSSSLINDYGPVTPTCNLQRYCRANGQQASA